VTSRVRRVIHSRTLLVVVTVVVTLLAVAILRNLRIGVGEPALRLEPRYAIGDAAFVRAVSVALGAPVVDSNRITTLRDGDGAFPDMLAAIRSAQKTITFEMYVYDGDSVGHVFARALAERARAGVKVSMLLDWVGSRNMNLDDIALLRNAGARVEMFRPLRWYNLGRINNRTHRKIIVIDGSIAYTGGLGIASAWVGHAQSPEHWHDLLFRIEGPVVAQMQAAFVDHWIKNTGRMLFGPDYFPALKPAGRSAAQVFASGPGESGENMELMYLLAIGAAERNIDIGSSYFVPHSSIGRALVAAMRRGVRVRVITANRHTDNPLGRRASRATWGEFLEAGAEIYEYQPTFYHAKVIVVDSVVSSIGSANFDPRSFRLNYEANVNVFDREFALEQLHDFEDDIAKSHRITLEVWRSRSLYDKGMDRMAALLAPLM
jgi:cardiolipin synthase